MPLIEPENILVRDHGTMPIVFTEPAFRLIEFLAEMIFTELHFKADGAIGDKPSFCLVFDKWDPQTNKGIRVYAQISLERLNHALAELGYTLYQP
jgi:hypothetical protein